MSNDELMERALEVAKEIVNKQNESTKDKSEKDLIDKVTLGATERKFREILDIGDNEPLSDYLSATALDAIKDIEEANRVLLSINMPYKDRKASLSKLYQERWSVKVGASLLLKGSAYASEEDLKNI